VSANKGETTVQDTAATVTYLPTDQLQPNDYNPNRMTEEEFAELAEEVRHLGRLPKPVVVREAENGYLIVDGEHGWRAACEVGLAEIPCEVIEAYDFEAMRQTYKRNQHGTHDRVALGQMFRRMMDERDISNRELAKEISVSEGTIRNALLFAEAAELRNSYARESGTTRDYWFERMTVRQARLYVGLPAVIRDAWLNSGCPDEWGLPEGVVWDSSEDIIHYTNDLEKTGIAKVFERGSWASSAKRAYELWEWHNNHRRLIGEDIDAYIRPVVELHPKTPTHVQFLEQLPMRDGKPFLTPGEWADALRVAWEKSEKAYEVLGMFRNVAKLKGAEANIPTDDLEDPRVALKKMEVEQDAPDFVRDADIPLRDKHFLTKGADHYFDARANIGAALLSDEERLQIKRAVVQYLVEEHKRYAKEQEARQGFLESIEALPPEMRMKAIMGGLGPPFPTRPPSVQDAWGHGIRSHYEALDKAEAAAILADPEKVIAAVVSKLKKAAPKAFSRELNGKPAEKILEDRLRAMPRPELLLVAAVLLRTSVTAWLDAVREDGSA
jgi:ParB/RepB/Spo0J family partition protein